MSEQKGVPIKKAWKSNYTFSSEKESSLRKEFFRQKPPPVYTSIDSKHIMKAEIKNGSIEGTNENLKYFSNEEIRLNTDSNTDERTIMLESPIPIAKKKNRLPALKNSGKKKSRYLAENNDNFQEKNAKHGEFASVHHDHIIKTSCSKDSKKKNNADVLNKEITEGQESQKFLSKKEGSDSKKIIDSSDSIESNSEKDSEEKQNRVNELGNEQKEKLGRRNPAMKIEETNDKKSKTNSKKLLERKDSRPFFSGFLRSVTNKISPETGDNEFVAQGTITKSTGEFYSFGVLSRVSQAIKKFKNNIRFKKIESLEPNQLSIINDWCWFGQTKKEGEMMKESRMIPFYQIILLRIGFLLLQLKKIICPSKCADFLSGLGEKIKIFNPKSRLKMTWDLLKIMIIFWNFFNISITLCFGETIENVFLLGKFENSRDSYYYFILTSFLLMIVDDILTLNTSYYELGALVNDRNRIFKNYVRKKLLINFLAEFPLFLQLVNYESNVSYTYLNSLFFLKYYNFRKAFKNLEEFLALNDKYEAFFHLFKLFLKIFIVAHILACLWHMVAYYKSDPEAKTWISYKCLDKEGNWTERYIYAVYFALTTMSTVGYGDIIPQSQAEVSIAMLSMFVGSGMFGYALNNIGELLKNMKYKEDQLKKEIRSLDRFMKSKNIDYELQSRARKYLEYVWNEENQNQYNEEEILGKLSHNLREEVYLQSNGTILKQYPMLFKNFSEKTMRQLIHLIHPVRYSPEEIIIEEGEQSLDGYFYMITQGEVELSLAPKRREERNCTIRIIKAGSSFGEISFFTDLPQDFTAVSLNYSTIYRLKKSDFLSIIRQNSEDWESFCMLRDKYLLYEDMMDIYLKCWSCCDNHPLKKCPALRYNPSRFKVINEHQKNTLKSKLERGKLARPRTDFHFNALKGKAIANNKSLPFSKLEDNSQNSLLEEESKEHIIGICKVTPERKISSDFKTAMEDIPISKSRESREFRLIKQVESSFRNRNSIKSQHNKLDSLHNMSPRRGAIFRADPTAKEKTENNLSYVGTSPVNRDRDIEHKEGHSKVGVHPPDNRHELFFMNFDRTKNLNRYFIYNNPLTVVFWMNFNKKKKKNPNSCKKLRRLTILEFINRQKSNVVNIGSPNYTMFTNTPSRNEFSCYCWNSHSNRTSKINNALDFFFLFAIPFALFAFWWCTFY